jgi:hypothetical protein
MELGNGPIMSGHVEDDAEELDKWLGAGILITILLSIFNEQKSTL